MAHNPHGELSDAPGRSDPIRPPRALTRFHCTNRFKFSLLPCLFTLFTPLLAAETNELEKSMEQLKQLPLEELLKVEVTTVAKRAERLVDSPSAVQVITAEDIRRSGASSLPEVLRLAPNLQVAQVDSRQWAISARGFNSGTADKLLVMIDGRRLYTPLFNGVFWDVQNVMLED